MSKRKIDEVNERAGELVEQARERGEVMGPRPHNTPALDSRPEDWPTSLVVGSRKWKAAVFQSCLTPDVEITADWSDTHYITGWLVCVRESVNEETGEVEYYPWLSLVTRDGAIIGTSSSVAPKQLSHALKLYSKEELEAGIPIQLRRRPSRNGQRSYHELRVVEE